MRGISLCLLCSILASAHPARATVDSLRFGPFGTVRLYHESPRPANVVLFISGDGGWNLGVVDMARALASLDAVVAGIDINHFLRSLQGSGEKCLYPAGDLENLGKAVQQRLKYDAYRAPLLVGYSSGATLVYAALAQSPSHTFKGGISLGFCPDLPLDRPMCHGDGLDWQPGPKGKGYSFLPTSKLEVPWVALQGTIDQVCNAEDTERFVRAVNRGEIVILPKVGHGFSVQKNWMPQFRAAFAKMTAAPSAAETAPPLAPEIGDLPLVEAPSAKRIPNALVIILSGDGGWETTEQGICHDMVQNDVSAVGLNSLRYFWKERTPDGAARDLERIARHYMSAWHKSRLVLVGYSFGADVLPFLASRLPQDLRRSVNAIVLIGPGRYADFKFHLGDWFGRTPAVPAFRTKPEIEKLRGVRVFCFYGKDDTDVLCTELDSTLATSIPLAGGHRVWGRYAPISKIILEQAR